MALIAVSCLSQNCFVGSCKYSVVSRFIYPCSLPQSVMQAGELDWIERRGTHDVSFLSVREQPIWHRPPPGSIHANSTWAACRQLSQVFHQCRRHHTYLEVARYSSRATFEFHGSKHQPDMLATTSVQGAYPICLQQLPSRWWLPFSRDVHLQRHAAKIRRQRSHKPLIQKHQTRWLPILKV